mmetsp:Transcript_6960/g.31693  ORF Transcript_6960/g.31693 Transcript_6960/m.31693 type:complete len:319 (+) Transcript_6960:169-1125(+)
MGPARADSRGSPSRAAPGCRGGALHRYPAQAGVVGVPGQVLLPTRAEKRPRGQSAGHDVHRRQVQNQLGLHPDALLPDGAHGKRLEGQRRRDRGVGRGVRGGRHVQRAHGRQDGAPVFPSQARARRDGVQEAQAPRGTGRRRRRLGRGDRSVRFGPERRRRRRPLRARANRLDSVDWSPFRSARARRDQRHERRVDVRHQRTEDHGGPDDDRHVVIRRRQRPDRHNPLQLQGFLHGRRAPHVGEASHPPERVRRDHPQHVLRRRPREVLLPRGRQLPPAAAGRSGGGRCRELLHGREMRRAHRHLVQLSVYQRVQVQR